MSIGSLLLLPPQRFCTSLTYTSLNFPSGSFPSVYKHMIRSLIFFNIPPRSHILSPITTLLLSFTANPFFVIYTCSVRFLSVSPRLTQAFIATFPLQLLLISNTAMAIPQLSSKLLHWQDKTGFTIPFSLKCFLYLASRTRIYKLTTSKLILPAMTSAQVLAL